MSKRSLRFTAWKVQPWSAKKRVSRIEAIIKGEDQRILLVIGPCSSGNEEAVMDYARRLADLQEQVKDQIFIVMRVYTAKPSDQWGWL